jgi:hypothetical protein
VAGVNAYRAKASSISENHLKFNDPPSRIERRLDLLDSGQAAYAATLRLTCSEQKPKISKAIFDLDGIQIAFAVVTD